VSRGVSKQSLDNAIIWNLTGCLAGIKQEDFFRIMFLTRIQYFILYFKIIFLVEDIGHEFYLQ